MDRKKQRGQGRRIKALLSRIDEWTPFQKQEQSFEHFHVLDSSWIESPKTSSKIKTLFIKKWLDKTAEFIANKPQNLPFCKVAAVIDYPHLWSSQLVIFYDKDY